MLCKFKIDFCAAEEPQGYSKIRVLNGANAKREKLKLLKP